jgi:hypothetical protein
MQKRKEIGMQSTRIISRHWIGVCALILSTLGANSYADSHMPPPPPGVLEVFACNYNAGKGASDLMAARDFYVKQADKAGIKLGPAYVWTLIKGDAPNALLWFAAHDNLAAFGAAADGPQFPAAQARFDSVATCDATNIASYAPMFQREAAGETDNDGAMVASYACNFKHGVGPAHVSDLVRHVGGVMGGMGDNAPDSSLIVAPITGGPNTADRYIFNVFDNMTAWTKFVGALNSSAQGGQLVRHFEMLFDCDASLWAAQQVIGGEG